MISKGKYWIRKAINFIKTDIWRNNDPGAPGSKWIRPFRIVIYTIRGLDEHSIAVRAAALTFFTLMSIVPVAALIFGIVKGFGMEATLNEYLYSGFPEHTHVIDQIVGFINEVLQRTKGGIVASVGFVVLLWAMIQVFSNIENAFNNIWEIKKSRSMARKFSDYLAVVFVVPILLIVSNGLAVYARKGLAYVSGEWLIDIVFNLLSLVAVWLLFTFLYYVLPNTRVKFKGAVIAGILAGTAFTLFQMGYFYIQTKLNAYNMVYGSFAALPLFLLWLQLNWMILLFGAELSFAYQNISKYEQERESLHICYDQRRKILLATMVVIAKHFLDNKGSVTSEIVAHELNMPVRIIRDVIFDMENAGFVVPVMGGGDERENFYVPGRDIHTLRLFDVLYGVEMTSVTSVRVDISGNRIIDDITRLLEGAKHGVEVSDSNVLIADLIADEEVDEAQNNNLNK